ncbi:MAG: glycosyltransferase family 4 protein [Gluconacetobacter diazotrophicus]|nr:glycosyltransferase family 4 protein [Gluconacetobacter diazotrophicus]
MMATPERTAPAPTSPPAHRPLRIGFVANRYMDPRRVGSWSGIPYHFAKSLGAVGGEIVPIYDLREPPLFPRKVRQALWKYGRGKRYLRDVEPAVLRAYARETERRLRTLDVDVLFSPSSRLLSEVETDVPTIFWTGATFASMLGFYDDFTNLAPPSLAAGHAAEAAALKRCALAIYASNWGARSAVEDYGTDPAKVKVVSYGANLDRGLAPAEVQEVVRARDPRTCRLLCVGVDWQRKGVETAIAATEALNARGVPARLSVVGCQPPRGRGPLPPCVDVVGFLRKSVPDERRRLEDLYHQSHFFIVPTRAEAFGVVFCEANAFALPCLATNVGGVPTAVRDGVNGQLFTLEAPGEQYAAWIAACWADPARYQALATGAFEEYQQRLCWPRAAETVLGLLEAVAHPSRA